MPQSIIEEIRFRGVQQAELSSLSDVLPESDVLYVTRVQKERFKVRPLLLYDGSLSLP